MQYPGERKETKTEQYREWLTNYLETTDLCLARCKAWRSWRNLDDTQVSGFSVYVDLGIISWEKSGGDGHYAWEVRYVPLFWYLESRWICESAAQRKNWTRNRFGHHQQQGVVISFGWNWNLLVNFKNISIPRSHFERLYLALATVFFFLPEILTSI